MSYLHLERKVKPLTSPLVRPLPPLAPTRRLPALAPRSSTEPPFGPKHPSWRCDTFIVPAAFPRSISGTTRPPTGPASPQAAAGGRVDLQKALEELYEPQSMALLKEVDVENVEDIRGQQQLYLSVNRYRRPSSATESRLTLVLAHANGFHKETWEPAMSDLLDLLDAPDASPKTLPVEEIWSLDCVIQGDSGVLNEEVTGNTFSWADHGRDIVNFLQSYINSPTLNTEPSPPPTTILSPFPATDSRPSAATLPSRSSSPPPLRNTHIVGIGHSFGGSGTAFAASSHPSLFSSIILIDPVLPPTHRETSWGTLAGGALVRKDGWTNREEAKGGFLKKGFFRSWDERVLGKYVEFGLRDVEGGNGVRLKTRPRDEAIIFADPLASSSRRAFARLSSLPSSLPVHFIFPDVGQSMLEDNLSEIVAQVPHATSTRIAGAGHLVPQDRPRETAAEIARFLRETYPVE